VRTFFFQMFLAFWISTIGIFFVATAFDPDGEHGNLENIFAFAQNDSERVNELAIDAYNHHGCEGLQHVGVHYLLSDASGTLFCGSTVPTRIATLLRESLATHGTRELHDSGQWFTITPVDRDGQLYAVIHRGPYIPRPYFPHLPRSAFPVSLIVTFIFAFLLTRPVRALSRAFRQFSSGDLAVRLPAERRRSWSGLGGSDVSSLMLDFNNMADRIGSLVQAQKTLVRDVSHELRSPLARLRLALEMAREESSQPSEHLDRVEMEADRVNDLIGQMLTLSLIENTGAIATKSRIGMAELIESLMPDLTFEAEARSCTIRFHHEPELYINGSEELLRRAIENIARNAIRFTASSSAIDIRLYTATEAGKARKDTASSNEMIAIDIEDRGPGVPEESLPLLFRAFYRTDSARQDSTGGFGVGLSIAERAIHLHNGTVFASNRTGGGLTVSIRLPEDKLPS